MDCCKTLEKVKQQSFSIFNISYFTDQIAGNNIHSIEYQPEPNHKPW